MTFKRLGYTFLIFSVLTLIGCASQDDIQVKGYDPIKRDESDSLALSTLKLVYFNRYASDANFSDHDWQQYLTNTRGRNHFARETSVRSSSISKQLQRFANVDATRPFDQPNIISWVEVDSLDQFGTKEFRKEAYAAASTYILNSLNADIVGEFDETSRLASVEFGGDTCEVIQSKLHPKKIRNGEWLGSGEDVTCFMNFEHEIIRPLLPQDWHPTQIKIEDGNHYVLVRTRIANFEAFLYGQTLSNSFIYFPPRRTTHKRGRSITTGKGTPFLMHQNEVFLFARPFEGKEAKIQTSVWVSGNKLP
jgi:hypothetical protein